MTGQPIIIGGSGPDTGQVFNAPEQREGLQAAVDSINSAGGINGRPLQLEYCDGKFDPNAEISCARKLAAKKIVAAIDPFFAADASDTAYKILDDAGIPQITRGTPVGRLTSTKSYLLSSGAPGWFYGEVASLVNDGARKIAILISPSPSAQFASQVMARALDSIGVRHTTVVFDPKTDPTGATAAAKATADGVQGVTLSLTNAAIPVVVSAMRHGGYTGEIASCSCSFTPETIQALGANAEGIKVVSQIAFSTDTKNPGVGQYLSDLKKFGAGAPPKETGLFAWSAVKLFAAVVKPLDKIDAASVTKALNTMTAPVDIGAVAPWQIAGKKPPVPEWPRVVNTSVQIGIVRNGAIQPNGEGFINPFDELRKVAVTKAGG
ncbi:ABC transporter substrate-binding protein [Streptomyces sp. CA-106131]|uniref:ABC transporter substrate-binding protein n=1 Tax=Streptomyces sp. CA-106131 TaxID=3240045 RepID=UPI003D8D2E0C